ncbi:MAG: antitoxin [Deltaproteobacteria bacterium]|nr:antitoxin [Deltaproteobacteria bacterium]MBW1928999.1 antitoxin [Deltaproteobacteria bacterium]MBW2025529.1 antitoxin [Deltaproteobacteria bacterium]MBW2126082.1 antitoxin [Deltaproteobacteria bacterium]
MRTTIDIEDDVLIAIKEMARRERVSAGKTLSRLAREALAGRELTIGSRGREEGRRIPPFSIQGGDS